MAKIRLAGAPILDSIVDGPGLRITIFTQGCPHHCKGCHNPETWNLSGGILVETQSLIDFIDCHPEQTGITFSGGDPMIWRKELTPVAQYAKSKGMSVWCYTGYVLENIYNNPEYDGLKEFLSNIDVLVDGPFELDKKSMSCIWRGSTNQRLIDIPSTLLKEEIVLWNK